MKTIKTSFTLRELTGLIKTCERMEDLLPIKEHLLAQISRYDNSDQGFLLSMLGLRMMKITNENDEHIINLSRQRKTTDNLVVLDGLRPII